MRLECKPIVIVEGIHAMHERNVLKLYDLKIFVQADDDVRLARRCKTKFPPDNAVLRDIKERGRTSESVLTQYNQFVKPAYNRFIRPRMKLCNIIVPFTSQNNTAVDLVYNNLKAQLKQMIEEPTTPLLGDKNKRQQLSFRLSVDEKNPVIGVGFEMLEDKAELLNFGAKLLKISYESKDIYKIESIFTKLVLQKDLELYG